jgi:hypothetical protein
MELDRDTIQDGGFGWKADVRTHRLTHLEFEREKYGCLTRPAGTSVESGIRGKGRLSRLHFEEAKSDRQARSDVLADDNTALSRYGFAWHHILDQPNCDDWAVE